MQNSRSQRWACETNARIRVPLGSKAEPLVGQLRMNRAGRRPEETTLPVGIRACRQIIVNSFLEMTTKNPRRLKRYVGKYVGGSDLNLSEGP
jgi:hypothetical protein